MWFGGVEEQRMGDRFGPRSLGFIGVLAAALACGAGCTYVRCRGKDALDMVDVGFTFTKKPQFGLYANCPFIAPGGYSKVDGQYVGIGGGKVGVMEHHQEAAGLLLWGREDVGWSEEGSDSGAEAQAHEVGPLGVAADSEGNPVYKPQCAHYFHLGFVGVTGNLNYKEWGDFFLGWFGADISKDDRRVTEPSVSEKKLVDLSARLSRPRGGLQLLIRSDKETYAMDEPIALDVELVNRTGLSRSRRDRPRDLSVYFEPLAKTPEGRSAEWLFKFYVFDMFSERARYRSPQFDVPAEKRGDYYHHVTLPPGAFVGRRFVFPPGQAGDWLQPGRYILLVTYEVSHDYPYVIINPELTSRQAEQLGTELAYTRVWTGALYSNVVAFRVEGKRFLGIF
jgi:hypothetical protein